MARGSVDTLPSPSRELSADRWHDEVLLPSMTSRLPSLRAVAIFVAAGRALSFTAAPTTVNLTPSAVSPPTRDLAREPRTAQVRPLHPPLQRTPAVSRHIP